MNYDRHTVGTYLTSFATKTDVDVFRSGQTEWVRTYRIINSFGTNKELPMDPYTFYKLKCHKMYHERASFFLECRPDSVVYLPVIYIFFQMNDTETTFM